MSKNLTIELQPLNSSTVNVKLKWKAKKLAYQYTIVCEPIVDLTAAFLRIQDGKSHFEEVGFFNEPGEIKMLLMGTGKSSLQISIYKNEKSNMGVVFYGSIKNSHSEKILKILPIDLDEYKHLLSFRVAKSEFKSSLISAIVSLRTELNKKNLFTDTQTLYSRRLRRQFKNLTE